LGWVPINIQVVVLSHQAPKLPAQPYI
jgi:hypothetical protein